MVLVMLGTQNNSFHRLLEEVQKCIDKKIINEEVIVQAGSTKFKSDDMKIFKLLPAEELNKYIEKASFVITHGGVGSIVTCLKMGKKVIAVPRYHKYGEHVNDHQLQIIETFDGQGFIKGIRKVEDLEETIKQLPEFIPEKLESNTQNIINIINNYIQKDKKLLFSAYSLEVGGIEKALVTLANKLESLGYDITIVLEKKEGLFLKQLASDIKIIEYCPCQSKNILKRKIANLLKRIKFSLKYKNQFDFSASFATYSMSSSFVARVASKNTALWVHTDYLAYFKNDIEKVKNFFNNIHYTKFKNLVFVSEVAKDNFLKVMPNNKQNILVCNNLINYKQIQELSNEKVDIEKKENEVYFLNVGRHEEESKRLTRLIQAAKMLKNDGLNFKILLVGEGKDTIKYKEMVKQNKLDNEILFLGSKENPYPYFKIANCVVLTSEYEGYPVVFLESLALNKPIITTQVSDYKNIEGKFGYTTLKTPEDIYKKMKIIIEKGFKYKEEFNPETFNQELIGKLEKIF